MRFIANNISWISGWASDISIWEDEIRERFPDYTHRFVGYSDLISSEEFVVPKSEIVIGWSMGTLALLRNLHKKPKEQKWILVCPIADFCAAGCWPRVVMKIATNCWPQAVVRAMTPKIFSALMGKIPKIEKEKWLENAMRYSPKQLALGLDYLVQKKADLTVPCQNVSLLFGKRDKIVPLAQKNLFLPGAGWQIHIFENLGHWLPDYIRTAPWSALVASEA